MFYHPCTLGILGRGTRKSFPPPNLSFSMEKYAYFPFRIPTDFHLKRRETASLLNFPTITLILPITLRQLPTIIQVGVYGISVNTVRICPYFALILPLKHVPTWPRQGTRFAWKREGRGRGSALSGWTSVSLLPIPLTARPWFDLSSELWHPIV